MKKRSTLSCSVPLILDEMYGELSQVGHKVGKLFSLDILLGSITERCELDYTLKQQDLTTMSYSQHM